MAATYQSLPRGHHAAFHYFLVHVTDAATRPFFILLTLFIKVLLKLHNPIVEPFHLCSFLSKLHHHVLFRYRLLLSLGWHCRGSICTLNKKSSDKYVF